MLFEVFNYLGISLLNYSQFILQCHQPEWTLLPFILSASFGYFPSLPKNIIKIFSGVVDLQQETAGVGSWQDRAGVKMGLWSQRWSCCDPACSVAPGCYSMWTPPRNSSTAIRGGGALLWNDADRWDGPFDKGRKGGSNFELRLSVTTVYGLW